MLTRPTKSSPKPTRDPETNSKFAPGNGCLEYQYKVSFFGDLFADFSGAFLLFVSPTLGSWELDSAKDSTRFLINSRAHRACWSALQGKKTGKTVKPSHFPAVQPSCNHHIHHSNWHNWSKNWNMFDKFAFFPSLWPTMMRYSMQVRPSSPWPCRACPT